MCRLGHKLFTAVETSHQHFWRLAEISEYLYPSKTTKKAIEVLTDVWEKILNIHRELWPGQAVPVRSYWGSEVHTNTQGVIATSLFVALVVWSVCAPKRPEDSRRLGEDFLAALFTRAAQSGFPVSFQKFEANGSCTRCDTFVDSSLVIDCWTDSMSNAMAIPWDSAVLRGMSHPRSSRSQTSVIDLVVWAFRPVPKRANIAPLFHERRALIRKTALSITTHMAHAIEQIVMPELKSELASRIDNRQLESGEEEVNLRQKKLRRKRIPKFTANLVAERASRLLVNGQDTWMIEESVRPIHFFIKLSVFIYNWA